MFNLGAPELLLIFLVVLLLFGGSKLPELARGLGKAIRSFKEEAEGIKQRDRKSCRAFSLPPSRREERVFRSSRQQSRAKAEVGP
jgi:sec-independent protein translocase protein TatA